jgi:hypothetical protein
VPDIISGVFERCIEDPPAWIPHYVRRSLTYREPEIIGRRGARVNRVEVMRAGTLCRRWIGCYDSPHAGDSGGPAL